MDVKQTRTCNRHFDCDQSEYLHKERWLDINHPRTDYVQPISFHCHDDECEECFGN